MSDKVSTEKWLRTINEITFPELLASLSGSIDELSETTDLTKMILIVMNGIEKALRLLKDTQTRLTLLGTRIKDVESFPGEAIHQIVKEIGTGIGACHSMINIADDQSANYYLLELDNFKHYHLEQKLILLSKSASSGFSLPASEHAPPVSWENRQFVFLRRARIVISSSFYEMVANIRITGDLLIKNAELISNIHIEPSNLSS